MLAQYNTNGKVTPDNLASFPMKYLAYIYCTIVNENPGFAEGRGSFTACWVQCHDLGLATSYQPNFDQDPAVIRIRSHKALTHSNEFNWN